MSFPDNLVSPVAPLADSTPPCPPARRFQGRRLGQRSKETAAQRPWLWDGFLAAGMLTLLTSQWKSGKTTLVANLLARMRHGGSLLGRAVRAGRAVVISEEAEHNWDERVDRLNLDNQVEVFCRPFPGRPRPDDWEALLEQLAEQRRREGLDLVVIDSLGYFLPTVTENDAGLVQGALRPVQRLADTGVSMLLVHHPHKKPAPPGRLARGSGILCSTADVLLEMHVYNPTALRDRRRRLEAFSRSDATPRQLLIELNPEGTDYLIRALPDPEAAAQAEHWQPLRIALEEAAHKLTRAEIGQHWPADFPQPREGTLWKCLNRAVEAGWVCREGSGYRGAPYRYWLPEMEAVWQQLYGKRPDKLPDAVKEKVFQEALQRGELQWVEDD